MFGRKANISRISANTPYNTSIHGAPTMIARPANTMMANKATLMVVTTTSSVRKRARGSGARRAWRVECQAGK